MIKIFHQTLCKYFEPVFDNDSVLVFKHWDTTFANVASLGLIISREVNVEMYRKIFISFVINQLL